MDENSSEVVTAIRAVTTASALCQKLGKDFVGRESFLKSDKSPVTIADYGSQAIICKFIKEAFPRDTIETAHGDVGANGSYSVSGAHGDVGANGSYSVRNAWRGRSKIL
jgi:3'-phosphoadenosine 5'-phosphosulfate (PAPS) 3'-phosphatase